MSRGCPSLSSSSKYDLGWGEQAKWRPQERAQMTTLHPLEPEKVYQASSNMIRLIPTRSPWGAAPPLLGGLRSPKPTSTRGRGASLSHTVICAQPGPVPTHKIPTLQGWDRNPPALGSRAGLHASTLEDPRGAPAAQTRRPPTARPLHDLQAQPSAPSQPPLTGQPL